MSARLFVALELSEPQRATLARLAREAARLEPTARAVRPEALHLTLAVLGESLGLSRERVRQIEKRAQRKLRGAIPQCVA